MFNDEIISVFAGGIMDVVAEYVSNILGYEDEINPNITLKDALINGLEKAEVDDSYERYGIEVIFRLLEQSVYDDMEELDIYRRDNTNKVLDLCINYYKKVFLNAYMAYPGITVGDFMTKVDDYDLDVLAERETELIYKQIKKLLKDYILHVNSRY